MRNCSALDGEHTDIVEKEMYRFEDRGGGWLALRPEATAGLVRAAIEHGLLHNQKQRLWTAGPMFRYERPQAGRYRQFHQIDCEALGYAGPDVDVEMIQLSARLWRKLGIGSVRLRVNSPRHAGIATPVPDPCCFANWNPGAGTSTRQPAADRHRIRQDPRLQESPSRKSCGGTVADGSATMTNRARISRAFASAGTVASLTKSTLGSARLDTTRARSSNGTPTRSVPRMAVCSGGGYEDWSNNWAASHPGHWLGLRHRSVS